jgi:hypothetical protein
MTTDRDPPKWLPSSVFKEAGRIHASVLKQSEPTKALELLRRLTLDPRMKNGWQELYKKNRSTSEFLYPAIFSWAARQARLKRLEASNLRSKQGGDKKREAYERKAQNLEEEADMLDGCVVIPNSPSPPLSKKAEQDLCAAYFFHCAFHYALDDALPPLMTMKEAYFTMTGELWLMAGRLLADANKLRTFGMEENATELERIASDCDEHGYWIEPDEDDPCIVDRHRGNSDHERLRAYVLRLSGLSRQLFGKFLYRVLATVTNVALNRCDMTDTRIREMLRDD